MNDTDNKNTQITPNQTILIIDDDSSLNHLICKELQRAGYFTASATTGAEAIQKITSAKPALATLDYKLPDMSGQQVIERLKEMNNLVPFIMITGEGDENIAVNAPIKAINPMAGL